MKSTLIFMTILLASVICIKLDHEESIITGRVTLQSDNGKYLARCHNCGRGLYPDSPSVTETNSSNPLAIWTIELKGRRIALKADNGVYLSRCRFCWLLGEKFYDSAFVYIADTPTKNTPFAQWMPIYLGDHKWALQADNHNFLSRCHNCVAGTTTTDYAFAQETNKSAPSASWIIIPA